MAHWPYCTVEILIKIFFENTITVKLGIKKLFGHRKIVH